MEEGTKVVGLWESLMEQEYSPGLMAKNMKGNTDTDKNKAKEFLLGLTEKCTTEAGCRENNTAKA